MRDQQSNLLRGIDFYFAMRHGSGRIHIELVVCGNGPDGMRPICQMMQRDRRALGRIPFIVIELPAKIYYPITVRIECGDIGIFIHLLQSYGCLGRRVFGENQITMRFAGEHVEKSVSLRVNICVKNGWIRVERRDLAGLEYRNPFITDAMVEIPSPSAPRAAKIVGANCVCEASCNGLLQVRYRKFRFFGRIVWI